MPGLLGRALVVRLCIVMFVLCTVGTRVGTSRGATVAPEMQSLQYATAFDSESDFDASSHRLDSQLAEHSGFDVSHVVATDKPLGELFVSSSANPSSSSNTLGIDGADRQVTLIPLPAPVYLGLTGFAFVISVKFLRRLI